MKTTDVSVPLDGKGIDMQWMDALLDRTALRIILVIATVAVFSGFLPLLYLLGIPLSTIALKWLIIALSGFVAGLTARLLLNNCSMSLQFGVALAAILVNSFILGFLTVNLVGFNWNPTTSVFASPRWGAELALELVVAVFTLRLWHASPVKVRVQPKPSTGVRDSKPKSQPKSNNQGKKKKPAIAVEQTGSTRKPVSRRKIRTRPTSHKAPTPRVVEVVPAIDRQGSTINTGPSPIRAIEKRLLMLWEKARIYRHLEQSAPQKPAPSRMIRPRKLPRGKPMQIETNNVHLLGEVEHRCPYCLEVVEKNDPRGVKICPICQTQHHLDCWNITGVCQVPHQSE